MSNLLRFSYLESEALCPNMFSNVTKGYDCLPHLPSLSSKLNHRPDHRQVWYPLSIGPSGGSTYPDSEEKTMYDGPQCDSGNIQI